MTEEYYQRRGINKLRHYITLANDKKVFICDYVAGIKLAKTNPDAEFKYGLTTWWPVTGKEIMQQFRASVHDRINKNGLADIHYKKEK